MNRTRFGVGWAAALAGLILASPAAAVIDNSTQIDVNSISCYVTNHDSYAYNIGAGISGLEFPRGSTKTAVFAAGIWVGAKVDDSPDPTVKVGEYSWQWGPGTLSSTGVPDPDDSTNYVYKLKASTSTGNWHFDHWPIAKGAPTRTDGSPRVFGDETLWTVFNDRAPTVSNNRAGTAGTDPAHTLGLEIQQTTFAFSRKDALNNCIFLKYLIINKGGHTLHDTYMSLWADPDLGDANDDLVGCDTLLSVGYVYNASNNDGVYGAAPPCVGWDFFQGPVVDKATGKRLGMTSFVHYTNGRDPQSASGSYNNMQGLGQDGSDILDPNTGAVTKFDASGDPVSGTGFLDPDSPADRRLMLSTGPFTMAPGDTQEIVAGVIVGRGGDNKSSITVTKFLDKAAQDAFDANFDLANPPTQPTVSAQALNNAIELNWDDAAMTDSLAHQHKEFTRKDTGELVKKDYYFEGFNVYQGPTASGPWTKIATFDLDDSVQYIYGDNFNVGANGVQREVLQSGRNSGLRFRYRTDTDKLTSTRLVNNKPYYFAVTAYNYEANHAVRYVDETVHSLQGIITETVENDPGAAEVAVIPSSTTQVYSVAAAHVAGVADATVDVDFFAPDSANGHQYEVTFTYRHFISGEGEDAFEDSVLVWRLVDLTDNSAVLDSMEDFSGVLHDERQLGNFEVRVTAPSDPIKQISYTPSANSDWFAGIGAFGLTYFGGTVDLGANFLGSSVLPSQEFPIKLVFDPAGGQVAYAYRRDPGAICGPVTYAFEGMGTVPLKAYDVSNPDSPRQLNVAFVQNCGDSTDNNPPRWLPGPGSTGNREYLFVLTTSYSVDPPLPEYTSAIANAGEMDQAYAFVVQRPDVSLGPQAGDVLQIVTNRLLTTTDRFTFTWTRPGEAPGSVVNNDMSKIRVVPNPYLNHSAYEQSQFLRRVKFTHLPAKKVTIKIYNLAGDLVRTLARDDIRQAETVWDLLNEQKLPVASGVYIYRVEAADGTSVIGRLAVFLEREKLNFF